MIGEHTPSSLPPMFVGGERKGKESGLHRDLKRIGNKVMHFADSLLRRPSGRTSQEPTPKKERLRTDNSLYSITAVGPEGLVLIPTMHPLDAAKIAEQKARSHTPVSGKHDPLLVNMLGAVSKDPVADGELLYITNGARFEKRSRNNELAPKMTPREERLTALKLGLGAGTLGLVLTAAGLQRLENIDLHNGPSLDNAAEFGLGSLATIVGAFAATAGFMIAEQASTGSSWRKAKKARQNR